MHVTGVNVRNAPLITYYFDSIIQPGHCQSSIMLWERPSGQIVEQDVATDKNDCYYYGNDKQNNSDDLLHTVHSSHNAPDNSGMDEVKAYCPGASSKS